MRGAKLEGKVYEFRVEGRLDSCWAEWFEGLDLRYEIDAESGRVITILSGLIVDQSALHGILVKISSLNLTLLSVNQAQKKSFKDP